MEEELYQATEPTTISLADTLSSEKKQLEEEHRQYLACQDAVRRARQSVEALERQSRIPVIGPVLKFFQFGRQEELQMRIYNESRQMKAFELSMTGREKRIEKLETAVDREADPWAALTSLSQSDPEKFQEQVLSLDEPSLREAYNSIWELVPDNLRDQLSEKYPDFANDFETRFDGKDPLEEMAKEGRELEHGAHSAPEHEMDLEIG